MKIYLAARFARREELAQHRKELNTLGHEVVSSWLWRDDTPYEQLSGSQRMTAAVVDHLDLDRAEMIVLFADTGATYSHGGKHTEWGIALEAEKYAVLIGEEEQIFHYLPQVRQYGAWEQFINALEGVGSPWK